MIDLSLILPVYNEAGFIEPVLIQIKKTLQRLHISYECLLVENGSTDNSWDVLNHLAKQNAEIKLIRAAKGYGSAVIAGLKEAKGTYICYMPSDGQIDLKVFPVLWQMIVSGQWDIVKVRRTTRENPARYFQSGLYSYLIQKLCTTAALDINGSPRILTRKNALKLSLWAKDSFIDAEMAIKAHILHWRIKEVAMVTLPRAGGRSTRSWQTYEEILINILRFVFVSPIVNWRAKMTPGKSVRI